MAKDKKKAIKATPQKGVFTSGEIFAAREPLTQLMQQKFPIGVSYKLAKLASSVQEQLKIVEDLRNALIKEYGVASESDPNQITVPTIIEKLDDKGKVVMKDGKPVMIPNPGFAKFLDEVNELMTQEVKLVIEKVKLPEKVASTCDKCNHNMDRALELEPAVLLLLDKFIEI